MAKSPIDTILESEDARNLDRVLRSDPANIPEGDLDLLVDIMRRDRARFIADGEKRKAKTEDDSDA